MLNRHIFSMPKIFNEKSISNQKKRDIVRRELLQVISSLYGLSEIGDYCAITNTGFNIYDLRMQQYICDFSLFFRRCLKKLAALSGLHVGDFL